MTEKMVMVPAHLLKELEGDRVKMFDTLFQNIDAMEMSRKDVINLTNNMWRLGNTRWEEVIVPPKSTWKGIDPVFKFAAIDRDGTKYVFEVEPERTDTIGEWVSGCDNCRWTSNGTEGIILDEDWKKSLIHRPTGE